MVGGERERHHYPKTSNVSLSVTLVKTPLRGRSDWSHETSPSNGERKAQTAVSSICFITHKVYMNLWGLHVYTHIMWSTPPFLFLFLKWELASGLVLFIIYVVCMWKEKLVTVTLLSEKNEEEKRRMIKKDFCTERRENNFYSFDDGCMGRAFYFCILFFFHFGRVWFLESSCKVEGNMEKIVEKDLQYYVLLKINRK